MRLRVMIATTVALLVATAVAVILSPGQAQAAWDLAGYTWSNIYLPNPSGN